MKFINFNFQMENNGKSKMSRLLFTILGDFNEGAATECRPYSYARTTIRGRLRLELKAPLWLIPSLSGRSRDYVAHRGICHRSVQAQSQTHAVPRLSDRAKLRPRQGCCGWLEKDL